MFGDKQYSNIFPAYPTPGDIPETTECRQLSIPASTAWFAVVMGCLMSLTDEKSWQQFEGGITPAEAVATMETLIDAAYTTECGTGSDLKTVPFWETDDGSDAAIEDTEDTWYNEASWFVIEAFVATMVSPAAAVEYVTALRTLRLAFVRNGFGGIARVLVDGVEYALVDTYAAGTPLLEVLVDTGDDDPHTITIENTGEANENAEVDPTYDEYTIGIIRKNLRLPLPNLALLQRYDDGTDTVQTSVDGGDTWQDAPQSDPRNINHFPPPDTADPKCDAAARMEAWVEEIVTGIEDGLAISALAGTLIDFILGSFAVWAAPLALLLFLVEALITALIDIGLEDLQDSFTSGFYDNLLCYFYHWCAPDGRISAQGVANVLQDVYDNEVETCYNVMQQIFALTGAGGLNDLASTRGETGDCSGCDATWEYDEQFNDALLYGTTVGGDGVHGNQSSWVHLANTLIDEECGYGDNEITWVLEGSLRKCQVTIDLGADYFCNSCAVYIDCSSSVHTLYLRTFKDDGTVTKDHGAAMSGGSGCLGNSPTMNVTMRYITVTVVTNTSSQIRLNRVHLNLNT